MADNVTRPHMVMAPLETVAAGEHYRRLPLHVTILPWFDLAVEHGAYFHERMQDILIEERLSRVSGAERDLFGPNNDERVTRLKGCLLGVHCHAMRIVIDELGIEVDPSFTGVNYSPHVTDVNGQSIAVDDPLELPALAVVSRGQGRLKIVETVYEWAT